jgi:aarF domain-containing kinase
MSLPETLDMNHSQSNHNISKNNGKNSLPSSPKKDKGKSKGKSFKFQRASVTAKEEDLQKQENGNVNVNGMDHPDPDNDSDVNNDVDMDDATMKKMQEMMAKFGPGGGSGSGNGNGMKPPSFLAKKIMAKKMGKYAAMMRENGTKSATASATTLSGEDEDQNANANLAMKVQAQVEQLTSDKEALLSRCRKLESQNIIAAAQTLDIISIAIGIGVCAIVYYVYARLALLFCNYCMENMYMYTSVDADVNMDGNVDGSIVEYEHEMVHKVGILLLKSIVIAIPYLHNKYNYNITYRRFQVFSVAFIMIARIKLTRWRVKKYISPAKKDSVTATETDDNTESSSSQGPSNTSNLSALRQGSSGAASTSSYFGEGITEEDIWEGVYEINARFLYSSILRLRGLWTKSAQYLSSRADFVPIAYVRELSKLMDEAPSTTWKDVEVMLKRAGIMENFVNIEKEPIASASIGQVHLATLKNGTKDKKEKVVIKVQHPFAQTLLSDDFVSLRIIARITSILEPEYKFIEKLMNEWATEARNELDFNIEVKNLITARESVKSMVETCDMMTDTIDMSMEDGGESRSCDPVPFSVEIPYPHKELSSKQVMVMDFCEGKRIDDVEQIKKCNVPKEAVMNAVSQVFAHQMYASDIFNGDPHPGNIFIRPGTATENRHGNVRSSKSDKNGFTIVVLDWGLAKRLPDLKRIGFCQMVYAASTFDFGLMMDGFKSLGLELKRENVAEDMEGVRFLLRDLAPREKARKRVKAKIKTDIKRSKGKKKGEKVPMKSDKYPGEFFFFVRTNELLHGLGSKLGVDMKYLDVLKPFAEKGLRRSNRYMMKPNLPPDPILTENIFDITLQNKIVDMLDKLESSNEISGAQVCVINGEGKTLAHSVRGHMGSLKKHIPLRSDSVILGFSTTKGIAATLAHRLVQEGYLSYDEPICERIWPNFCPTVDVPDAILEALEDSTQVDKVRQQWQWKRVITLRHILSHSAGLWSKLPAKLSIKSLASCESCVKGFEYNPDKPEDTLLPTSEPGSENIYHYISFGWLVAGCCVGAYNLRHVKKATYSEVFEAVCSPLLSSDLKTAGFRPCGGSGGEHDIAFTDANIDLSRMAQMRREAEAIGEKLEGMNFHGDGDDPATKKRKELFDGLKGKEFMLDQRLWNSEDALNANVPAAGGRFSSKGLALFYHELGKGAILSSKTLSYATKIAFEQTGGLNELMGQTDMTGTNNSVPESQVSSKFGLGYQVIPLLGENNHLFGHVGVGGSLGFHHVQSETSIGIMLNMAGSGGNGKHIMKIISDHLKW